MKLFFSKIGTSGIAISMFVAITLLITLYFVFQPAKNEQILIQRGFRMLNQLGMALKEKDTVLRKIVFNSSSPENKNQDKETSIKKYLHPSMGLKSPAKIALDSLIYTGKAEKYYTIGIKDFITPLLTRKDFFSQYILLRNDTIVFSTLGGDALLFKNKFKKVESQNAILSFSGIAEKSYGDTIQLIQAGFTQKVKIQGKDYLFYAIPLKLNSKPDMYLGGLVEEKAFLLWKRNLPSEILVIFSVLLLAIIFGFPVLKIFLLGPLEKLSRIEVTLAGISLIGGTILLVVLMSEILLSSRLNDTNYLYLKNLNRAVKNEFFEESELIIKQLKAYRNAGFETREKPVTSILASDVEAMKPFKYRFFKAFFPADSKGNQQLYLTTYKSGEKSNVISRDYFLHPDKYPMAIDGDTLWYNMEPIYSNTTGEWAIAFSMRSGTSETSKIIALTTPMYSLKTPVLPDGYEFFLIENSGRIWYDSEEIFNLSDNLVEETNNDQQLTLALKSNATDNFKVTLNNQKYLLHISPIDNTGLFVVTLFNPDRTNGIEALSTTFVMGFFAAIYAVLILLVVLAKLYKQSNTAASRLQGKRYFFSWLIPKKSKSEFYLILLFLNSFIFVIYFILFVVGIFDHWSVNKFILFFLVFVILHYVTMYLIRMIVRKKYPWANKINLIIPGDYLKFYTYFLFSWFMVSSILPALFLMERFAKEEGGIYVTQQQQDLAQKINKRTDVLKNYFIENYPSNYSFSLLNERNQKGLYFKDIFGTQLKPEKPFVAVNHLDFYTSPIFMLARLNYHQMLGESLPLTSDQQCKNHIFTDENARLILKFDKITYPSADDKKTVSDTLVSKNIGLGMYKISDQSDGFKGKVMAFWILFIAVMFFVYLVVNNIVKRLFPYDEIGSDGIDPKILFKTIGESKENAIIVSIRKPEINDAPAQGFSFIDLAQTKIVIPEHGSAIIINFEKGLSNPVDLEEKIILLDAHLKLNPAALWLSKTPLQLVKQLVEQWKNEVNPRIYKTHIRHFERLVSGLPVFYLSQIVHNEKINLPACERLKSILISEIEFNPDIAACTAFLALDFKTCWVIDKNEDHLIHESMHRRIAEDFILKIQEFSRLQYKTIWDSLSKEEQFVLFDLAEDSVLNMNNHEIIKSLINKGVLKLNDVVEIVSQSFRNFILTEVDTGDLEDMQKSIKISGKWNRLRIPLILVATSIAIFLFVTQQNFLSNMNTFLVSIVTIAGTFLRFSGLFSKTKTN